MKNGPTPIAERRRAVALGVFDGVHLGHRHLIRELVDVADKSGLLPTVVTFSEHPVYVLTGRHPGRLMLPDEKTVLLSELGVRDVVELDFRRECAAVEADDFARRVLGDRLGASVIVMGHDTHFGRGRTGNFDTLTELNVRERLFEKILNVDAYLIDGWPVSATRIRELLALGKVADAARLLGRRYSLGGRIVKGHGRGRKLGFPTINIEPVKLVVPREGVYAGYATPPNGRKIPAAISIGHLPTFGGQTTLAIETYLLEFHGEKFPDSFRIEFVEWLREQKKFDNADDLRAAIGADVGAIRNIVAMHP